MQHGILEDIGREPEAKVVEDLICNELDEPSLDHFFLTSANLKEQEKTELNQFLKVNIKIFAWTPYEMPRIDPNFIRHELNVLPSARLVKQRGRRSATKPIEVVIKKVEKLEEASAITEVLYLIWLSNMVMVKKNTGK